MITNYVVATGTGSAADGAADQTIIATQGAGKGMCVLYGYVTVTTAAVGGGGLVALENGVGGTRFFEADADAVGHYTFNFGEDGFPLSANTLLNLTVDGAATTQGTARATIVAKVV